MKQEEVDVFKIGFKVVGESARKNHNEDSLVGEKHHLAVEIRKPASVVQKNYMDKIWFRLKENAPLQGKPIADF